MKIYELIYAFLIILFDFTVMYMLLDIHLKNIKKLNFIFSLIVFGLSLISSMYVASKYGRGTFTAYFPLLVQAPIYIVYSFVSKYKGTKLFFVFISTFIFSTPVIWSPFIVGAFVNYSIRMMTIASLVTYFVMLIMVHKYIAPLFHYALKNLQKNWVSLSLLPMFYTILSYLTNQYNHTIQKWQETSYFRILILAIIYSSYMLILILFKQTREQFIWKNEQSILTLQMAATKEHISQLKTSQNMASIYRHDLRHHLQYINTCILQSKFEESSNYIVSICSEIEESSVVLYCENDNVNIILSSYITKAKDAGIDMTINAVIPTCIHVATTDLCVVLANGIENAIYACEKTNDKEKKKIKLSCHVKNNKILIQIINFYDEAIEFQDDIPISNEDGHGIGIISIINITKKYKGIYSFVAKDNIFTLRIII
ncbi:GHKL domain-containing protein [Lutibacter sp. B2]|nr:GHKL domain-containing protein [Lutibacter sp. B2]